MSIVQIRIKVGCICQHCITIYSCLKVETNIIVTSILGGINIFTIDSNPTVVIFAILRTVICEIVSTTACYKGITLPVSVVTSVKIIDMHPITTQSTCRRNCSTICHQDLEIIHVCTTLDSGTAITIRISLRSTVNLCNIVIFEVDGISVWLGCQVRYISNNISLLSFAKSRTRLPKITIHINLGGTRTSSSTLLKLIKTPVVIGSNRSKTRLKCGLILALIKLYLANLLDVLVLRATGECSSHCYGCDSNHQILLHVTNFLIITVIDSNDLSHKMSSLSEDFAKVHKICEKNKNFLVNFSK